MSNTTLNKMTMDRSLKYLISFCYVATGKALQIWSKEIITKISSAKKISSSMKRRRFVIVFPRFLGNLPWLSRR